ncbi:hypothetical protein KIF53_15615 [Chromobacterium subtsugae]|uniref:Uncharacterized protein n=1 Tax=Chromobacterium subtsugae TaxID=251747 RepID=A0ABS7FGE1_9NEIS|nr:MULTISPECIES: hypothetical protein [Chromobacterium]MBW7567834.1 hypothetical protein [Chromobacterium subtsugae]MBW8289061.1 hypothetical protein [Chromobacterium subtsugae]WSE93794.1 hypothetical protein U6115_11280 [Chromobacterium subtsugae]WVH62171.1 hypothetical protein U6151_11300 [Chromobacterium subtsugae]
MRYSISIFLKVFAMTIEKQEFSVFFQQEPKSTSTGIHLGDIVGPHGNCETYEECQEFVLARWHEAQAAGAHRANVFLGGNQYASYSDGQWTVAPYAHKP